MRGLKSVMFREGTVDGLPKLPERRMYVVHGGLFSGRKNHMACDIRQALIQRGISEKDIIVLKSCFPGCDDEAPCEEQAAESGGIFSTLWQWGKTAMTFARNCMVYLDAGFSDSKVSRNSYRRLKEALPPANPGERLNVTFIGYSGGGQVGLTMAQLADTDPTMNLDRVITLGSPIMWNNAPARVAISNYVSSGDWVLQGTSCLPLISQTAPNHDGNDALIRFGQNVGHFQWAERPEVMDCLRNELTLPERSPVREAAPAVLKNWAY